MDIHTYIDQPTSQRQQTVYLRSYERNIPSQPLQPYLDARPVMTKYSLLPIIDPIKPIQTPLIQQATYRPEKFIILEMILDLGPVMLQILIMSLN